MAMAARGSADRRTAPERRQTNSPMHLLYITYGYKPAYRLGGPIWSVSALAEGMARRGHKVTVFATNSNLDEDLDVPVDQPVEVDGVEVWYFRRTEPIKDHLPWFKYLSQSSGYMYTPALRGVMQTMLPDVDIVHTHMPYTYPSRVGAQLAIAANKPLFYHQRGVYHPEQLKYRKWKKRLYVDLVEKPIMRRATGLIALTPDEIDSFKALGVKTPIHLVPNGIEVEKFRRVPRAGSLTSLGITDAQKVILFMGRIHPIKDPGLLIDAFIKLAEGKSTAVLVMAGSDEHGLLAGLRARVEAKNLSSRFIAPGMVTGDQKLDLLARADVFVLSSVGEGLSMATLEALASGTPVVISKECNLGVVAEAGAGAVVERNAGIFAEAIGRFLADPDLRAGAGQRAYALARDKFGWPAILQKLEDIYRDALGARTEQAEDRAPRQ